MTKIVCLIAPAPHSIHFVNRIHEQFPVSLVISEEGRGLASPLHRRLVRLASPRAVAGALRARMQGSRRIAANERILGPTSSALSSDIEVMRVASVNAQEVLERLTAERPDVLADHGTTIVRDPILATAPTALNLHWGLSPYYRGVRCTDWALINWDPYNIGVTIHELTRNIDGGPIWAQQRAEISPDDDVHSINMQLSRRGTDLTIRVLEAMRGGQAPPARTQDRAVGFLTLSRQWTPQLSTQIRHIEANGVVGRMLEHPARQALPIVELPD